MIDLDWIITAVARGAILLVVLVSVFAFGVAHGVDRCVAGPGPTIDETEIARQASALTAELRVLRDELAKVQPR